MIAWLALMRTVQQIVLAFCLLAGAVPALAQFETSSLLGTVRDRSDAVVAGAKVTITNLDTNITATKPTDESGSYEFVNVRPGRYRVRAEKEGFAPAAAENVQVSVTARQRVDLILTVGQVAEAVTVTAEVPIVESETSQRGQVVEEKKIVELPLN